MPILRREDGVQFAIQPYRETLSVKNTSLLKKEIHYLAQSHGAYVRLFKQPAGQYESVFSHEPGYLLGETVWHYYHCPRDLVYCEALPNSEYAILVIVHAGKVYLDAKMTKANIAEELTTLTSGDAKYDIFIYGNVPITQTVGEPGFVFAKNKIESFIQLQEPLYPRLPVSQALQLLPLDFALEEYYLGKPRHLLLAILALLILCVLGLAWYLSHPPKQTVAQFISNPYTSFQQALAIPNPGQQLQVVTNGLNTILGLPGWYSAHILYADNTATIQVHSLGGTTVGLVDWANIHQMVPNFSPQGAALDLPVNITAPAKPSAVANTNQVIAIIIDRMMKILPGTSVQVNNTVNHQVYNEVNLTVSFADISPQVLLLIGSNLDDLPVRLINCTADISNGLLSGNLQLDVVGT
jgi:hypothetical protein